MRKDANFGRPHSAAQRRGRPIRELRANELATVLGGTNPTQPKPDEETRTAKTRSGGFWRWLLG
jgi:hypothetical protein